MADLLASLVIAQSNSSQESFHSSFCQAPPSSAPALTSTAHNMPPEPSSETHASAFQAADLPIYDIDLFLTNSRNAALSKQSPTKSSTAQQKASQQAINLPEPISLGSKTSHNVATLNTLCQTKGLLPIYEIDGDASEPGFYGVIKIGNITLSSDDRRRSKKEAREGLAAKGLEIVKAMEAQRKQPESYSDGGKNWVGMLLGKYIILQELC